MSGLKGNCQAQRLFIETLQNFQAQDRKDAESFLQTALDYVAACGEDVRRCRELGLPPPQFLPHPDHIFINRRTGAVEVRGPSSPEEKEMWDLWNLHVEQCEEDIRMITQDLEKDPENKDLQAQLEKERKWRDRFAALVGWEFPEEARSRKRRAPRPRR